MDYNVKAESGPQLLARLSNHPTLSSLDERLLGDGPSPHDIIEVSGEASVGKTMLLLQWVSRAILPNDSGGKGVGVLLIDTDHHNLLNTLVCLLESRIRSYNRAQQESEIASILKNALRRLTILSVYDSTQLFSAFVSLNQLLLSHPLISFVVIDSLPAFYWSDRLAGGEKHMDTYLRKLLTAVQKNTQGHKVTVAFTRPSYFQSVSSFKSKDGTELRSIFINLSTVEAASSSKDEGAGSSHDGRRAVYCAVVRTATGQTSYKYKIARSGFEWI